MNNSHKSDPCSEFTSDSSWALGEPDTSSVNYFFSTSDKDSGILSEFGWNLPPDSSGFADESSEVRGNISCGLAPKSGSSSVLHGGDIAGVVNIGASADLSTSNPSVSSSSSEDPTEKSTGSGGKPPEIP